jgi:hypothetical protein
MVDMVVVVVVVINLNQKGFANGLYYRSPRKSISIFLVQNKTARFKTTLSKTRSNKVAKYLADPS